MTEIGIHTGIQNFWPKSQAQEIIQAAQRDLSPGLDHADAQAFRDILYCVLATMKPAALFQRDDQMYIKGVKDIWHRSTGGDATQWSTTTEDLADTTNVDQDIRIAGERRPL